MALVDLPAWSAVARHTTALAVVLTAELPAAATAAQVIGAHLPLCRSIIARRLIHLKVRMSTLTILICIPGCLKLNYFHFIRLS